MSYLKELDIEKIVKCALGEDIGSKDITTESVIPKDRCIRALFVAREDCVICGLGLSFFVFRLLDTKVRFKRKVRDGDFVKKRKCIAEITGDARAILTAERVALNFLTHLSGIATLTRRFVRAVKPYKVKILDTRKTIPCLRILEKYAVRMGGGFNHRFALDEMVLIKDNHLKMLKNYKNLNKTMNKIRRYAVNVELEVKNLKEFKHALDLKPDIIMLDNMSIKDMKKVVEIRNSQFNTYRLKPKLEASGSITLKNVRKIASCGIDLISIGALTHSAPSVDINLEII